MSSYYKKIDGKNYDRAMLEIAERSVAGRGDGRISLADSKSIIRQIKDGGRITDTEKRTLSYILEKYSLTETAIKHIEKSLADEITKAKIDEPLKGKTEVKTVEAKAAEKTDPSAKGGKPFYLIVVIVILAVIAIFTYIKYFYKGGKPAGVPAEKKENMVSDLKRDETVPVKSDLPVGKSGDGTDKAVKGTADLKDNADKSLQREKTIAVQQKKVAENEYLVKEGDSLIKISEAVYGDYKKWLVIYRINRGIIKDPRILYPGQVIKLPEK